MGRLTKLLNRYRKVSQEAVLKRDIALFSMERMNRNEIKATAPNNAKAQKFLRLYAREASESALRAYRNQSDVHCKIKSLLKRNGLENYFHYDTLWTGTSHHKYVHALIEARVTRDIAEAAESTAKRATQKDKEIGSNSAPILIKYYEDALVVANEAAIVLAAEYNNINASKLYNTYNNSD
jgi:hypothetical protein